MHAIRRESTVLRCNLQALVVNPSIEDYIADDWPKTLFAILCSEDLHFEILLISCQAVVYFDTHIFLQNV